MERTLKTHCILLTLLILVGCRHYGTLTSPFAGPYNYETYGPIKESLSFINDSVCIYRQYSMFDKCTIYINDTIGWRYETPHSIDLYRSNNTADSSLNIYADSLINGNLNFTYDICPKWYNMTDEDFYGYNDYKHPFLDDPVSRPNRKDSGMPFYIKYGFNHPVDSDKIGNAGKCMLWLKEPVSKYGITPLFPTGGRIPWRRGKIDSEIIKDLSEWIMNSYEYINYKVNYERKVEFDVNSILGKQFTYLENLYKKESVHFVNDSVCMHVASKRKDVSSPYMPIAMDTCRYTTKNNLIAIDFYKDSPCDTLTYGNGILFYSKVYQDNETKKYTHVVKPFIDETIRWDNKSDSINMIMSTYFNVYVPINLLPHTISVADENNLQEIEQIKSLIVEDQKNRRLGAWIIEQSVSPLYIEAISDDGLYLYRYVSNSGNIAVIMLEDDNIADSMDYIEGLTDYEHKGYYEIVNDSMVNVIFDERYRNYCQPDETTEEANVYHIRGVHSYKFANMKWELIKADTAILQDERKQFCGEEILKYIYP